MSLMNKLNTLRPLEHIMDLEQELFEIQMILDEIEHQGERYNSSSLHLVMDTIIASLMVKIEPVTLMRALQLPVNDVKKAN